MFNDALTEPGAPSGGVGAVPSLKDVTAFFRNVFTKGQLETECVIMTLICERKLSAARSRLMCLQFLLLTTLCVDLQMWSV